MTTASLLKEARELIDADELERAVRVYEEATATAADEEETTRRVYLELGVCRCGLGQYEAGVRALLRALDGDWARDRDGLAMLVIAFLKCNCGLDAVAALKMFEERFGAHPSGMTSAQLQGLDEEAREIEAASRPV